MNSTEITICEVCEIDAAFVELDGVASYNIHKGRKTYIYASDQPLVRDGKKAQSTKQFNAMHVWIRQVVQGLNDAGLYNYVKNLLNDDYKPVDWTEHSFKEQVWKPLLEAFTGDESTKLQTSEIHDRIRLNITRLLAESHGFTCPPWPSNH